MESPRVFEPGKSKYLVITADYIVPFILSISVLVLFYLALFSTVFRVKQVTCQLDYQNCTDPSVLAEIDKLKGQNIFRVSGDPLSAKLTSGDFTIREVRLKKTLPDQIFVELQSVYPVVAVQVAGDPKWVALDQKFRVIAVREIDPNVPTVIAGGPLVLTVGQPITQEPLLTTLKLALRLSGELTSIKSITLVDDNTINIMLESGVVAIFSPKVDELKQLRALQAVLSDGTITKGFRTIDVRFIQPVLR
jgi:cell division septal protein FtsQ